MKTVAESLAHTYGAHYLFGYVKNYVNKHGNPKSKKQYYEKLNEAITHMLQANIKLRGASYLFHPKQYVSFPDLYSGTDHLREGCFVGYERDYQYLSRYKNANQILKHVPALPTDQIASAEVKFRKAASRVYHGANVEAFYILWEMITIPLHDHYFLEKRTPRDLSEGIVQYLYLLEGTTSLFNFQDIIDDAIVIVADNVKFRLRIDGRIMDSEGDKKLCELLNKVVQRAFSALILGGSKNIDSQSIKQAIADVLAGEFWKGHGRVSDKYPADAVGMVAYKYYFYLAAALTEFVTHVVYHNDLDDFSLYTHLFSYLGGGAVQSADFKTKNKLFIIILNIIVDAISRKFATRVIAGEKGESVEVDMYRIIEQANKTLGIMNEQSISIKDDVIFAFLKNILKQLLVIGYSLRVKELANHANVFKKRVEIFERGNLSPPSNSLYLNQAEILRYQLEKAQEQAQGNLRKNHHGDTEYELPAASDPFAMLSDFNVVDIVEQILTRHKCNITESVGAAKDIASYYSSNLLLKEYDLLMHNILSHYINPAIGGFREFSPNEKKALATNINAEINKFMDVIEEINIHIGHDQNESSASNIVAIVQSRIAKHRGDYGVFGATIGMKTKKSAYTVYNRIPAGILAIVIDALIHNALKASSFGDIIAELSFKKTKGDIFLTITNPISVGAGEQSGYGRGRKIINDILKSYGNELIPLTISGGEARSGIIFKGNTWLF